MKDKKKTHKLVQSWRWYGPTDVVSLQDIKQAGASHVVTALHHVPHGEVWSIEEIRKRLNTVESAGLKWEVVESLPVHESIKTNDEHAQLYLKNYKRSLRNLAACGIKTVCYNFMPVLDWTRTDLAKEMSNGAKALSFNWVDLAVFELFVLKRAGANKDYPEAIIMQAEERHEKMSEAQLKELSEVILMGIPDEGDIAVEDLQKSIEKYSSIGTEGLRENLTLFLKAISSICEEEGIKMTIHPDDPPYPILGLPRIASNVADFTYILNTVNKDFNGVCFCTGSLGAGQKLDLLEIFDVVKERVYFAHLRNVRKDEEGNFFESDHLDGDVDMYAVLKALIEENDKRAEPIPFRPDHGHQMLDDLGKKTNPGYSAIGRLRGLAELRGLELGIRNG